MSIIVRKKGWSSPNCLDVRKCFFPRCLTSFAHAPVVQRPRQRAENPQYYVYTTNQFLTMKIGGGQAGQF